MKRHILLLSVGLTLTSACVSQREFNQDPLGTTTRAEVAADVRKYEAIVAADTDKFHDATSLSIAQVEATTAETIARYQHDETALIAQALYSITVRQAEMEEKLATIDYQTKVEVNQTTFDSIWQILLYLELAVLISLIAYYWHLRTTSRRT